MTRPKSFNGMLELASYLQSLPKTCVTVTTVAGTGDVPAGLRSVAIVKTSTSADTVVVHLSDGSTYTMTEQGEVFSDAALEGQSLPAYTFTGTGIKKWHGIK